MKLFDEHGPSTPQIEKLAEKGLVYTHAFSNAPVCSVARSTLISGCLAPRIGAQFHRKIIKVPMPEGLKMFPAYLREAGYYTTNNSKEDYNIIKTDDVWDESSKKATWKNRKPGQPFFHVQNFGQSHEGNLHFSKKQMEEIENNADKEIVFIPPIHPKTETFKYSYARYHDRIQVIDGKVGEIVQQLEEEGLLDDTFIFYFGDHGGVLPGSKGYIYETGIQIPLVVRIPEKFKHLVDFEAGTTVDGFVSFIDFGPTLLQLAGIQVPKKMDGKPFLGESIKKEEVNNRDVTYSYADRFDEKYDLVRAVRVGNFKYIRNYQPFNYDGLQNNYRYKMLAYKEWRDLYFKRKLNKAQSQFFEARKPEALYDLEADPYETNNLAYNPDYAGVVKKMRVKLQQKLKAMPDLSFFPESYLVEKAFGNPEKFSLKNKKEIMAMIDIADLNLLPFDEAKEGIKKAIHSEKQWERYWGLIVCSTFGNDAIEMVPLARGAAEKDTEPLNRARAAEFLALIGKDDPVEVVVKAIKDAHTGTELSLILNTLVLLQDGPMAYKFPVDNLPVNPEFVGHENVKRRLLYLKKEL